MADPRDTPSDRQIAERGPAKPTPAGHDAADAQRDEARDEGAGKQSVPVEDLTTANDEGQG